MKEYLLKRPMLLCGIICSAFSVAGFYSRTALVFLGVLNAFALGFMILKQVKPQLIFSFVMAFVMLLSTVITLGNAEKLQKLDGIECDANAVICEITYKSPEYNCAVIQIIQSETLPKGTKLSVYYKPQIIETGQALKCKLKLKSTDNSKYKADNYSEKIFLTANMETVSLLKDSDDFVLTEVGKTRKYIKDTLFSKIDFNESATLCALVFGDRSYFTDEFHNNVKESGVSHVMVVSGMHLSVLVLLFTYISEKLIYNRYIKALIMLTVVLLLSALCGFTMSMLRAGITYFIAAIALVLKRDNTPANTLGAATVFILIFSPFALLNVALQLSLLSTFGILAVSAPIIDYSVDNNLIKVPFAKSIFSIVIITLSATVMTLPVSIYVFGYISTVSVFTNLLISFAVTVLLCITICALILNIIFSPAAQILFIICEIIAKYINNVINFFGSLSFSSVDLPRWTAIPAIIFIIIIFWALLACKNRIDMIKLEKMREKIKKEGGKCLKWQ